MRGSFSSGSPTESAQPTTRHGRVCSQRGALALTVFITACGQWSQPSLRSSGNTRLPNPGERTLADPCTPRLPVARWVSTTVRPGARTRRFLGR
jgi:hypothetical protein